jgi:hypothetical protein
MTWTMNSARWIESEYHECAALLNLLKSNSKNDQSHDPLLEDERALHSEGNMASTHTTAC